MRVGISVKKNVRVRVMSTGGCNSDYREGQSQVQREGDGLDKSQDKGEG